MATLREEPNWAGREEPAATAAEEHGEPVTAASSRYWSTMPVPALRLPVWTALAAGVASSTSAVVTMPSDVPFTRCRYSPCTPRGAGKKGLFTWAG